MLHLKRKTEQSEPCSDAGKRRKRHRPTRASRLNPPLRLGALLLVSRTEVHRPGRINGGKHVAIEVDFTYEGKIRIPLQIGGTP